MARTVYIVDPANPRRMIEVAKGDLTPRYGAWGKLASEEEIYGGARTAEGIDISSRKKRREHMKLHGLTDPGDYSGEYWKKKAEERRKFYAGEVDVSGGKRREDLARRLDQIRRTGR